MVPCAAAVSKSVIVLDDSTRAANASCSAASNCSHAVLISIVFPCALVLYKANNDVITKNIVNVIVLMVVRCITCSEVQVSEAESCRGF